MAEQKILIISNQGLSNNESNGRILHTLFSNYSVQSLHNYCIGGCLDIDGVHYIKMSDKANVKSLLSCGIVKPQTHIAINNQLFNDGGFSVSNKKAIHYYIRNILFRMNYHIKNFLVKYINNNDIDMIFLFATDAPYLYRLARLLSNKTHIPLITYTCEDYPLKDYNYIEKTNDSNFFFKRLMKSLHKETQKAFNAASKSFFNSELLMNDYIAQYKISNPCVKYLASNLKAIQYKPRPIKNIVYGGNLYGGRLESLIEVGRALKEINPTVIINVYGRISDDINLVLDNIHYQGVIPYNQMIDIYSQADMLLHIDGFDEYYIKDCKHAFSTKMNDCYKLGIPFFVYAPAAIAGTQYALSTNSHYVAISREELKNKLKNIINGSATYKIDYNKITNDFRPFCYKDLFI